MTSYEAACLLISLLKNNKIDANITAGGVNIFYKRHQRKEMIDTLNGIGDVLDRVEFYIYLCDFRTARKHPMIVVRVSGKPIAVSHKIYEKKR